MVVLSVIIGMSEQIFSCGVFIFWVSNWLRIGQIGQKPCWISIFFALNDKNYNNLNYRQSFVNVFCQKRCSWRWLSVKLPVANKCNCSQYGLMFITWIQWTRIDCGNKTDYGRPAMFLSVQVDKCFAYWTLSRKIDKSHSFNMSNYV